MKGGIAEAGNFNGGKFNLILECISSGQMIVGVAYVRTRYCLLAGIAEGSIVVTR